jgi:DNA-nicking Smr family endonuclease
MTRKPIVPDAELWESVRAAVKPLKSRPLLIPQLLPKEAPVMFEPSAIMRSEPIPAIKPVLMKKAPPPLTGLDRRLTQKLSRGKVDIDAYLDLHGLSVELARVELRRFITTARQQGLRTVLVITGKGDSPYARHTLHGKDAWHAPERQGRIRREVTGWFEEAELRAHISGFQPAHPRHGGGGAFYVRMRRKDRSNT